MENKVQENNVVEDVVEGGATTEVKEVKTFTQEEVDKMISKRLQRERKDIEAKIEAERKEAEELAKLSEQEKQKKLFEKQVKEFEETKRAFENEKLLNETSKQLAAKNLPIEFAGLLKGNDAETTFENIKMFEVKFNEALEKMVNERLKGSTPKTATIKTSQDNPYSKSSWNLTKQMELEMNNPALAKQLQASANK